MAEGIIGGDEEPAIAASAHHRSTRGFRQHIGVIHPMHGIGCAGRPCQVRCRGPRIHIGLVLLTRDIGNRETDRRCRHIQHHIHALVIPLARDIHANIGTVLVIGIDHFDIEAAIAEFLHRLTRALQPIGAANVAVWAGHVVQHADADGICRLRAGRAPWQATKGSAASSGTPENTTPCCCHDASPLA